MLKRLINLVRENQTPEVKKSERKRLTPYQRRVILLQWREMRLKNQK
jgi:hypothetical protein